MQNKAFSMEDLFAFLNAGVSAFHSTAAAAAIQGGGQLLVQPPQIAAGQGRVTEASQVAANNAVIRALVEQIVAAGDWPF